MEVIFREGFLYGYLFAHPCRPTNVYDVEYKLERELIPIMEEKGHVHTYVESDDTEYSHSHDNDHEHKHSHQNTKVILNRISRAIGHLKSVKRMVEDGKDCSEILIQLSAVMAAINNTGKVILKDHIEHCIVNAVQSGDETAIENLNKAIDRYIK